MTASIAIDDLVIDEIAAHRALALTITSFDSSAAAQGSEQPIPWSKLVDGLSLPTPRASEAELRQIRPSTSDGDLRAGPVDFAHGVLGIHTAGTLSLQDAAAVLKREAIQALGWTLAGHTAAKPRWALLLPLRGAIEPPKYAGLVSSLNGLLGGALDASSWDPLTCVQVGRLVSEADQYKALDVAGMALDARLKHAEVTWSPVGLPEPQTAARTGVSTLKCPAPLRELKAWLVWRAEFKSGEAKPRKVPRYVNGARRHGKQGSDADRAQLATFEAALAAARKGGFNGVGLALLPEFGITALDFDDCVTDGQVLPEVLDLIQDTYAELSPSGRGVRAFVQGKLPDHKSHASSGWPFGFETFTDKGFVTFTGNTLPHVELAGLEDTIAPAGPGVLALYEERFNRAPSEPPAPAQSSVERAGLTHTDIAECLAAMDPSMGHDSWLQAGMAIHHETVGEGFDLWDEWSAAGEQYPGSDELRKRWDSFGQAERPVTGFALLNLAGDAGERIHERITHEQVLRLFEDLGPIEDEPEVPVDPARAAKFAILSVDEFLQRPRPDWLVKHVLPQAGVGVIYGAPASGKTFVTLDLVTAISRGVPDWRGNRVRQGRVVYVVAEGAGGFRNRVEAFRKTHGDLGAFSIIDAAPNLLSSDDPHALTSVIRQADVIVIDTLAQSMPGGDENTGKDMGAVLARCLAIHRRTGALVLLVHHSGKDPSKGSRGWSGIKGNVDVELQVVREGEQRALVVGKQKDGEDGLTFGFELQQIKLGVDRDGDPVTSCVVVEAAFDVVKSEEGRKPGKWQAYAIAAWNALGEDDTAPRVYEELLARGVELAADDPNARSGGRDVRKQRIEGAISSWFRVDGDQVHLD